MEDMVTKAEQNVPHVVGETYRVYPNHAIVGLARY